jgi:hypothetical protein
MSPTTIHTTMAPMLMAFHLPTSTAPVSDDTWWNI